MTANQDLTEEQANIIRKVEKLLALANSKKGNEAEAAVAASKAQEMLAAYNIDMAMVEQGTGSSGKREDVKQKGGVYLYQRDLWRAVAELNFCMYWTSRRWGSREATRTYSWGRQKETVWAIRYEHRVVGRTVNVVSTRNMAEYLEQTIERLVMARVGEDNTQRFSRWSVSYRKGAAARIIEKVQDRRDEFEAAEAAKKREAEHRAARAGVSTSTVLTIADVRKAERDANNDFLHGEGWSAKREELKRLAALAAAQADAEYARWAAANPEEARKKEKAAQDEADRYWAKRHTRGGRTASDDVDLGAYWAGYDEAKSVGIDRQASGSDSSARRIK